jgi:hypothetical protein
MALRISLHEMRVLRRGSLYWFVAASVPFWLVAAWPLLGGPALWPIGLIETGGLALTMVYAALEHRCGRNLARIARLDRGVYVHFHRPVHESVRSGLWYGLAALSAIPWMAWVIDRPLPVPAVWRLAAMALAIAGLLCALAWVAPGGRSD